MTKQATEMLTVGGREHGESGYQGGEIEATRRSRTCFFWLRVRNGGAPRECEAQRQLVSCNYVAVE